MPTIAAIAMANPASASPNQRIVNPAKRNPRIAVMREPMAVHLELLTALASRSLN
jgi:hypothetical protein